MSASTAAVAPRRENPILRLFSSIWFGITLLSLILAYACVFSALPQIRLALEMTEMAAFSHWSFAALVVLFCVTLVTATIRRVRFNVTNLGVLTVHSGLLILTLGSVWYFSNKIEGNVMLMAPRIEILNVSRDGARLMDQLPAEKGQAWERVMPAFGGAVRIEVADVKGAGLSLANSVVVRAKVGDKPVREITLSSAGGAMARLDERLALRLPEPDTAHEFFDRDLAALHFRKATDDQTKFVPLAGLPTYRERFLPGSQPILDRKGAEVESRRTRPAWRLLGFDIPTGWFEGWRLPLKVAAAEMPFDAEITGYLPYIAGLDEMAVDAGAEGTNPGVNFSIAVGSTSIVRTLFATPAESLLKTDTPVEFRWAASQEEKDELLQPLAGPNELTIEIKDPPVKKVMAVEAGQKIAIEGTTYEIEVADLMPDWPMMTPGFEGASSPVARVNVSNGQKKYNRTVVQRFPQLSQDIDEQGTRHREGPYDPNLVLRYRTSERSWITLVAGPELCRVCPPMLAVFDEQGKVQTYETRVGQKQHVTLPAIDFDFTVTGLFKNAERARVPIVEPRETRRPVSDREASAIRVKLTGKGAAAGWSKTVWCSFTQYPRLDRQPVSVQLPNDPTEWLLYYSLARHELGGEIALDKLTVKFFPGRDSAESWRSDLLLKESSSAGVRKDAVYTNQTCTFGEWTLFQANAAQDHWSFTGIGVGNRLGISPMVIGSILVPLGCMYAFYVKPILRRRKQEKALATAAKAAVVPVNRRREEPAREPAGVGS